MFEDWKNAWREAVENFQRELHGGAAPRVRAMEREVASAAGALRKLDDEILRTRREADSEAEAEATCRRREKLAHDAGDEETEAIAAEYAVRHAERAAVLRRKAEVLEEERKLLARDIDTMRGAIAQAPSGGDLETGPPLSTDDDADDRAFSRLEQEARERAAAERLEELKRRMRG